MARALPAHRSAGPVMPPSQPIRKRDSSGPAPLSFAQQRLWFLEQLTPGLPLYHIATGARIFAPVSARVLQQCVNEVVRRHEALRTLFRSDNGVPSQIVLSGLEVAVKCRDLSATAAKQREAELSRLANEEARRRFQLDQGPLLRVTLVCLQEREYVLLMTMHHIISDGWSLNVLSRELGVLYDAYSLGRPSPLPPQVLQYADYAIWQRDSLSGQSIEEHLAWWRGRLAEVEPLRLLTDHPRPAVASFAGTYRSIAFGAELRKSLSALGRQERCTLFMTLLAGFSVLLSRYTGQDEIVIGTPVANRNQPELESVVGLFVNTLVVKTDTAGSPTFRELLWRARDAALDAWAHQDLPFEKLVEELHPQRDLSRNPLFQVTLQLYPPVQTGGGPQSTVPIMGGDRGTTHFELAVNFQQINEGLDAVVEYHTDLYDAATIDQMMEHYRRILESAVADPDQPISHLQMIDATERERVTIEWNQTQHEFPEQATVDRLFAQQAARTPDAPALRWDGGIVTYAELDAAANRIAESLGSCVSANAIIGVLLPRNFEMISALLGIWKAGAAWIPLDPATPPTRVKGILRVHARRFS